MGVNQQVHVLRRKAAGVPLQLRQRRAAWRGSSSAPTASRVDSMGNVYTTETYEGKRVQRFKYTGMGSAAGHIGVAWPSE